MDVVKTNVNAFFAKKEPWQIASITASTTLLAVWLYQFITKEESEFFFADNGEEITGCWILFVNLFDFNFRNVD